jgi:DNA-binding Lrp family transcriptional regulator
MVHYVFTLYLFDHYEYLGRYKLAQSLNISNAKARKILLKLKEKQLIEKVTPRLGHRLSAYGREILIKYQHYLKILFQRIYLGKYTVGKKDTLVCVEVTNIDQVNTVMLRDEALINGARGCTVFLRHPSDDIFLLNAIYPPLPEKSFSDQKAKKKIYRLIAGISWPKFVIIVGTADNVIDAQIGAVSAGLLLLPKELHDLLNF